VVGENTFVVMEVVVEDAMTAVQLMGSLAETGEEGVAVEKRTANRES